MAILAKRLRWARYCVGLSLLAAVNIARPETPRPPESSDSPATAPSATRVTATQPTGGLAGFRTVDTAIAAKLQPTTVPTAPQVGYLGIAAGRGADGKLVVQRVDPASPAAGAGFNEGDVVLRAGADAVTRPAALQEWLLGHSPGETVKLTVLRGQREIDLSAELAPASRPMKAVARRGVMGVQLRDVPPAQGEGAAGEGAQVEQVSPGMPAEKAGLQPGDVVVEVDGVPIASRQALTEALLGRAPDDEVKVGVKRGGKLLEVRVKLAADPSADAGRGSGGRGPGDRGTGDRASADRGPGYFKKDVYRDCSIVSARIALRGGS